MTQTVYLLVGCPGAGKSYVGSRLAELFTYVRHDLRIGKTAEAYINDVSLAAQGDRPVLAEAPFSVGNTKIPLERRGLKVLPVFIQEEPGVIEKRYLRREGRPIPKGHITRQLTYGRRAKIYRAFEGNSDKCLEHLLDVAVAYYSKAHGA